MSARLKSCTYEKHHVEVANPPLALVGYENSQESQQGSLSSPETQGDSGQTSPHSLASESPSLPPTLSTNGVLGPMASPNDSPSYNSTPAWGMCGSEAPVKVEHLSAPDASHLDSGYPTTDSLANYTGEISPGKGAAALDFTGSYPASYYSSMQAYQQFGAQNPAYSMQAASNFYNQASQATAYNVLSQSYGVTGGRGISHQNNKTNNSALTQSAYLTPYSTHFPAGNGTQTAQNPYTYDGDRFNSCQVIYSQFGLAIHQNDHQARRRFVEWAQNEIAVVPDFHKRILFSDEAHFWLNGYVNKQNCRVWSEANPQVYVETPLHPKKLTVNGDRYRAMITNFFIPELNNHDVQELWFQQDGATCHTARATIDLLKDMFGDRLISRFGPVNWPPRSRDLTPLDYFLWGYVKSLVYADKPQMLDHLEDNIRRVIADIRPQMLEKVIENWTSRLDYIRANRGSPMPEIIFKM
ncbi:eyes absent homolog [Trichonephila clavipes]|nr:eyes absent homolog [Trichonephila clavipes]